MCSPTHPPAPSPLDNFASVVRHFDELLPGDDIATAFANVKTSLMELVGSVPDPNAYAQSVQVLQVTEPVEPADLDKLKERVRYAYDLLP